MQYDTLPKLQDALKAIESELPSDFDFWYTCSLKDLESSMQSLKQSILDLSGDKELSDKGSDFIFYCIVKLRLKAMKQEVDLAKN